MCAVEAYNSGFQRHVNKLYFQLNTFKAAMFILINFKAKAVQNAQKRYNADTFKTAPHLPYATF